MRALLPDALLPDAWHLQERTGLLVDGTRIHALVAEDALEAAAWERFPGETWVAAPVLAHAHVESHDAPAESFRRAPFAAWIEDLVAWRRGSARLSTAESARAVQQELGQSGCGTALALVDARDAVLAAAPTSPARSASPAALTANTASPAVALGLAADAPAELLIGVEFLAPDPVDAAPIAASATSWAARGVPVALHAPYSVSEAAARAVFQAVAGRVPVSVHLGEHAEERALLRGEPGMLGALMQRMGESAKSERFASPVDWLFAVGGARPGTVAVHCTDLDVHELRRLDQAGVCTVYCPGTQIWFGRPVPAFAAAGVPLPALGCDSRASNTVLDPLYELQAALRNMPAPGPQAWWHAATVRGAAALARPDLGVLYPGRRPRVLRIPALPGEGAADLCARLASAPQPLGVLDALAC